MPLDTFFQSILWEYKLESLDISSDIVAKRVLSLGDRKHSDYWIKQNGQEKAKKIYIKNRNSLDKRSQNYWDKYFNVIEKNTSKSLYEQLHTPTFSRSFR